MNNYAVKAADLRAKYIVDKYRLGMECTACSYNYKKYVLKDFSTLCYGDDMSLDITDLTNNKEVTCTSTVTEVVSEICESRPSFIDCDKVYEGCIVNNFEDNDSILSRVVDNNETLYFNLSSLIVGSTAVLNTDRLIEITSSNISIEKVNNKDFVMNLLDYINALNVPGFTINGYYVDDYKLLIEAEDEVSFSITTKANEEGDSLVRGVIITEDGLESVQLTVGAAYTPVASLVSPESTVFKAGVTCSQYNKC